MTREEFWELCWQYALTKPDCGGCDCAAISHYFIYRDEHSLQRFPAKQSHVWACHKLVEMSKLSENTFRDIAFDYLEPGQTVSVW